MTKAEQLQNERLRLQVEREREQAQKRKAQKRADIAKIVISGAIAIISAAIPLLLLIFLAGRY